MHQICKPAVPDEITVYEHLASQPTPVTRFAPQWHGFITIPFRDLVPSLGRCASGDGLPGTGREAREDSGASAASGATSAVGAVPIGISGSEGEPSPAWMPRAAPDPAAGAADGSEAGSSVSPWADSVFSNYRHKRLQVSRDGSCSFIILEDVSARFRCPCILDIKMGTRQHGALPTGQPLHAELPSAPPA